MKRRYKPILVSLISVLAIGCVTSLPACADPIKPVWEDNGRPIPPQTEKKVKSGPIIFGLIEITDPPHPTIRCPLWEKAKEIWNKLTDKPGKGEVSMASSGCEIPDEPSCNTTTAWNRLPYEIELVARNGAFFEAVKGIDIEVSVTGSGCSSADTYDITGNLEGEWDNATSEVTFPAAPLEGSSLESNGEGVTISGSEKVELDNGGTLEVGLVGQGGGGTSPDTPPEYVKCEKVAVGTGGYKTNACTKYEPSAYDDAYAAFSAAGVTYTSTSKAATLEGENGSKIACTSSTSAGEIAGFKTGDDTVTFLGCESKSLHVKCQNSGSAAGEVETTLLTTTLGFVDEATHKVGTDFAARLGPYSAEFECGGNGLGPNFIFTSGSVIGATTAVDAKGSTVGKVTLAGKKGKQTVEEFEGGAKDTLTTYICAPACTAEGSAEIVTSTNTYSSAISIKAEQ